MTDEKLALLEHVTYIDSNVLEAANIDMAMLPIKERDTVAHILKRFDDEAINNLRNYRDKRTGKDIIDGTLMTGKEWANIVETIKHDEELSKLKVRDVSHYESGINKKVNLQIAYDIPDTKECIITYKGTSGRTEWEDNVRGLYLAKTPCQEQALEFFDKQAKSHDKLTVVGHSKGANKAMFVTIASRHADKIDKCVAIDGQGFSNQFLETYANEIKEQGDKITNYYVSSDFVNILMKQVPNSQQVPCKGFNMTSPLQAHCPDSIFERDAAGDLLLNKGNPSFYKMEDREESMKVIQGFVSYTMDNRPLDKLERIGNYLAPIAGATLGGEKEKPGFIDKIKNKLVLTGLILRDPMAAADVLKAVHEYNRDCGITGEQKKSVIEAFSQKSKSDELDLCQIGEFLEKNGTIDEIKQLGQYMARGGEMTVVSVEERFSRDLCDKLQQEHICYFMGDSKESEVSLFIPSDNLERVKGLESDLLKEMGTKYAAVQQSKEVLPDTKQQMNVVKNHEDERCI